MFNRTHFAIIFATALCFASGTRYICEATSVKDQRSFEKQTISSEITKYVFGVLWYSAGLLLYARMPAKPQPAP